MTIELRLRGYSCSQNRVARLMAQHGIEAYHKTAFRPKTTCQDPTKKPAPNLLKDRDPASSPGEVLINDITYVATKEGWSYLAVTLDLYSRKVLGWHLADSMETSIVIKAAEKALSLNIIGPGSLYHSDRGSQYTSFTMRKWIENHQLECSMSATGYCYDNATCESFFASLKREAFPENCVFETKAEARRAIFSYIESFYNNRRIHSSLGNQSPDEFIENFFKSTQPHLN